MPVGKKKNIYIYICRLYLFRPECLGFLLPHNVLAEEVEDSQDPLFPGNKIPGCLAALELREPPIPGPDRP